VHTESNTAGTCNRERTVKITEQDPTELFRKTVFNGLPGATHLRVFEATRRMNKATCQEVAHVFEYGLVPRNLSKRITPVLAFRTQRDAGGFSNRPSGWGFA